MKKAMPYINIGMSVLTMVVMLLFVYGCSSEQLVDFQQQLENQDSDLQKLAEAVAIIGPVVSTVSVTLPYGVWLVLGADIASGIAAAIVAARKKEEDK